MTIEQFETLPGPQRDGLKSLWKRSPDGSLSFPDFVARATEPTGILKPYVGIGWCGMFVGIETDGYTHS